MIIVTVVTVHLLVHQITQCSKYGDDREHHEANSKSQRHCTPLTEKPRNPKSSAAPYPSPKTAWDSSTSRS